MQALLYALPASGNAGADNDSPYTVLTSGLEWSQKPARKATPPPHQHTGSIQYLPLDQTGLVALQSPGLTSPGEMTDPGNQRDSALPHHAQLPYWLGGHGLSQRQHSFQLTCSESQMDVSFLLFTSQQDMGSLHFCWSEANIQRHNNSDLPAFRKTGPGRFFLKQFMMLLLIDVFFLFSPWRRSSITAMIQYSCRKQTGLTFIKSVWF